MPEYDSVIDEAKDLPNQLTAQLTWALQPVSDAVALAHQLGDVRAEFSISSDQFGGMLKGALKGEPVSIDAGMSADARAKMQLAIDRVKEVGAALKGIPKRVKAATKNVFKLAIKSVGLVAKATKEVKSKLSGTLEAAAKIELQADLKLLAEIPAGIKAAVPKMKSEILGIPAQATTALTDLTLVFGGGKPKSPRPANLQPLGEAPAAPDPSGEAPIDGEVGSAPPLASNGERPSILFGPPGVGAVPEDAAQAAAQMQRARGDYYLESTDWWSAAEAYEQSFFLDPSQGALAFKIGEAAWKAGDCVGAKAYIEYFQSHADPVADGLALGAAAQLTSTQCVQGGSDEVRAARAGSLAQLAGTFAAENDAHSAAFLYVEAAGLDPNTPVYLLGAARESVSAGDCNSAQVHAQKFLDAAGRSSELRAERKEAAHIVKGDQKGTCSSTLPDELGTAAQKIYLSGQASEDKRDFLIASRRYEVAARLSGNPSFALRRGLVLWQAGDCEGAGVVLRPVVDGTVSAEDSEAASGVVASIASVGCPAARWQAPASAPEASSAVGPEAVSPISTSDSGNPGRGLLLGGVGTAVGLMAGGASLIGVGANRAKVAEAQFALGVTGAARSAADDEGRKANALIVTGASLVGVGLVTGTVLVIMGMKKKKAGGLAVTPLLAPEYMGVRMGGRF